MRDHKPLALGILIVVGHIVGCGPIFPAAFSSRFPDNHPTNTKLIVDRISLSKSPTSGRDSSKKAVVVGMQKGTHSELFAYDIDTGELIWRRKSQLRTQPQILTDIVLAVEGNSLSAFELETGRVLWRSGIDHTGYLGAARSGKRIVYSIMTQRTVATAESVVRAVNAHTGDLLWERKTAGRLGRPAAYAGLVFLPWDKQNLVVLDFRDGREKARFRSSDDVVDWVKVDGSGLYFGDRNIYRIASKGYAGTRASATLFAWPFKDIPGQPRLNRSAFDIRSAKNSIEGRIQLHFHTAAADSDEISIRDDRFYLVFYRYVFGFDATGKLGFVVLLDEDIIASQSVSGGFIVLTQNGILRKLDAGTGTFLMTRELGFPVSFASIQAEGLSFTTAKSDHKNDKREQLRSGLIQIAADPDNRLVLARMFAIRQLAQFSNEEVVKDLLDIYRMSSTTEVLKQAIAKELTKQKKGGKYLIRALFQRYDFLQGTRPPPFSVIIPALVKMRAQSSVPALIRNLNDPETPISQLPEVLNGIIELGDTEVTEPLRSFVSLYRSDSSFSGHEEVLTKAAQGLLLHGGALEKKWLSQLANDPLTLKPLAQGIHDLLYSQEQKVKKPSSRVVATAEPDPIPSLLSQESVNATFARHADEIRKCIIEEIGRDPTLSQVRFAFIINRDGSAHGYRFVPNTEAFRECLLPKVKQYRFPRSSKLRQLGSYLIAVRNETSRQESEIANKAVEPKTEEEPWWAVQAARANPLDSPSETPWWKPESSETVSGSATPPSTFPQYPSSEKESETSETVDKWWLPIDE